jgi:hypothetical protein
METYSVYKARASLCSEVEYELLCKQQLVLVDTSLLLRCQQHHFFQQEKKLCIGAVLHGIACQ